MPDSSQASARAAHLPSPPSELRSWLLAGSIGALGLAVLIAVLTGAIGRTSQASPPPVLIATPTPVPGPSAAASAVAAVRRSQAPGTTRLAAAGRSVASHSPATRGSLGVTQAHRARSWMEGFYPIYATAQRTFGVNWLLVASIHSQETAFSTAPSTYHGLNFAHCCGGPMQFNVTNGRVTTWDYVSNSYIYGRRPTRYNHQTAGHPSIYDDFDSVMAAAHLLSAEGAGYGLDGSAWPADRERRAQRAGPALSRRRPDCQIAPLRPRRPARTARRPRGRSPRPCLPAGAGRAERGGSRAGHCAPRWRRCRRARRSSCAP